MSQTDLLADLLSSNPNEPASKGIVLLLRTEMKSEFKAVRADIAELRAELGGVKSDVSTLKSDVAQIKNSLNLVAEQVAYLVSKS